MVSIFDRPAPVLCVISYKIMNLNLIQANKSFCSFFIIQYDTSKYLQYFQYLAKKNKKVYKPATTDAILHEP